jgi:hypothetical protein
MTDLPTLRQALSFLGIPILLVKKSTFDSLQPAENTMYKMWVTCRRVGLEFNREKGKRKFF